MIAPAHSGGEGEVLTFTLGRENYGVSILKVQEIRGYGPVTQIANAPAFIKGVMNLRGIIVPVIDMRIKFDLGVARYDEFTVVIILSVGGQTVGIVVDSVADVIDLRAEQIKPPPELGTAVSLDYLTGLGTLDDRMVILVDIDRLIADELGMLDALAA